MVVRYIKPFTFDIRRAVTAATCAAKRLGKTRYVCTHNRMDKSASIRLGKSFHRDLEWCIWCLGLNEGVPITSNAIWLNVVKRPAYVDAATQHGAGGFVQHGHKVYYWSHLWTPTEQAMINVNRFYKRRSAQHITVEELWANGTSFILFNPLLNPKDGERDGESGALGPKTYYQLMLNTDNMAAKKMISGMKTKRDEVGNRILKEMVIEARNHEGMFPAKFEVDWLAGVDNGFADDISRGKEQKFIDDYTAFWNRTKAKTDETKLTFIKIQVPKRMTELLFGKETN